MRAKVCLVGPQGAGKTSFAKRLDGPTVSSQLKAGTTFASVDILVGEKSVLLEIFDISGEDNLKCMGPIYYKGAKAALCIFDLTSEKSLQALQPWIDSVKNNANDECILLIIGNKSDAGYRQVSQFFANKYAEKMGAKYFEISALTGKGLLNVLIYLAKHLMRLYDCYRSYAAKRSITSNFIEYTASSEKKMVKRRFSFPLSRSSLKKVEMEKKLKKDRSFLVKFLQ